MVSVSNYKGTELDRTIKVTQESLSLLVAQATKLQETLNQNVGKRMAVKSINITGRWRPNIMYYDSSHYTKSWKCAVKNARAEIKKMHREIEKAHTGNLPAIESNKLSRESLYRFMDQLGFPRAWKEYKYKTSRSNKKTEYNHIAGWIDDCTRWLRTQDGYDGELRRLEDYKRQVTKFEEKKTREDAQKKREQEQQEEKKRQERIIPVLIGKYGLDIQSEPSGILDAVLSKDKYLNLAHCLLMNRNDWSDGYDYAQCGLNSFTIETPQDQEIYDDIQECIENWDGDGRVFRDTEWNYGRLFELGNEGLTKDYNTIQEFTDKY